MSFASPNLTWTGNLAAGATATITFSVTVNNPDTGNKILTGTITSATAGSNCFAGSTDARCTATVAVQGLTIASSVSTASTTPGATVQYTVTVTNSGQAAYTGATSPTRLAGVLDDAVYNGDAAATVGSVSYTSPNLTWTGNLAVGRHRHHHLLRHREQPRHRRQGRWPPRSPRRPPRATARPAERPRPAAPPSPCWCPR